MFPEFCSPLKIKRITIFKLNLYLHWLLESEFAQILWIATNFVQEIFQLLRAVIEYVVLGMI